MEGIYLIHTREFFNHNEKIYKLGRSHHLSKRIKQYPNGSNIICILPCQKSIFCEKQLINIFKTKFIQHKKYGNEYFEGDYTLMVNTIIHYLFINKTENIDITNINKIENKKVENKKVENKKIENEKVENEKVENEKVENKKVENEKVENEKVENKKVENEKVENKKVENKKVENKKIENEKVENEKVEKKKVENEKVENEKVENKKVENEKVNNHLCCPKCKNKFKYKSILKSHFQNTYHCLLTNDEIDIFFKNNIPKNNIYNCKYCTHHFSNIKSYNRHKKETKCNKLFHLFIK
jgi:flagellar biosynthesis GTPase FlhF